MQLCWQLAAVACGVGLDVAVGAHSPFAVVLVIKAKEVAAELRLRQVWHAEPAVSGARVASSRQRLAKAERRAAEKAAAAKARAAMLH